MDLYIKSRLRPYVLKNIFHGKGCPDRWQASKHIIKVNVLTLNGNHHAFLDVCPKPGYFSKTCYVVFVSNIMYELSCVWTLSCNRRGYVTCSVRVGL